MPTRQSVHAYFNATGIRILCLIVALALALPVPAEQAGVIQGQVTSTSNGGTISDVFVSIPDTDFTAITDDNGNYRLVVPAGSYQVWVQRTGYTARTLQDTQVSGGQTVQRNIQLSPEMEQLVVFGRANIEGSTASVLSIQQDATTVTEVVGSEEFSRIGDSTAADTLQRVTGLTVEDDKFVVIRGQPRRYTSTLFNGSQLPSLDPIQQLTPLDLFPSGVLSNISVQKAYTADRQGSFGSGQVQMNTTGLPAEDFIELKVGSAFNFHTIDNDPLEFGTGDDLFATVDPILKLPAPIQAVQEAGTPIGTLTNEERDELGRSFSNVYSPSFTSVAGPDGGFSLTGGKRFDTDKGTFGASLAFDYGQKLRFERQDRQTVALGAGAAPIVRERFTTERSNLQTNLGGLLALTGDWDNHEVKSNTFWIRDASERVDVDEGVFFPSDQEYLRRFTLEYERREMIMQQFTGSHNFADIRFEWRGMYSSATRDLPDRRSYQLQNSEIDGSGTFILDRTAPDLLRRFNSIDDENYSFGGDVSLPMLQRSGMSLGLKAGADNESRDRLSEIRQFGFNSNNADRTQPMEEIFADELIGTEVSFTEFSGVANDYNGDVNILGGYAQLDLEMPERFRVVLGMRAEAADFKVQTFQSGGALGAIGVESGFKRSKGLPSLVGSWFMNEDMQLRAGLTRSLSYPALVEISDTTFIDPDTDESFNGNPDLGPAVIDSADLRWEWYPARDEALTLGVFYKDFTDPIERSFAPVAGGGNTITHINAAQGEVFGAELNGRFGFGRVLDLVGGPDFLNDMHIGGNLAWQDSEVQIDPGTTAATNPTRRMTGQPEMLANLQLGYTGAEHIVRLVFGYVSDRLITAGIQGLPDEFQEPRFDLKLRWSYTPIDPATISLELANLLNDAYERTQGGFTTRRYKTGITGALSLKWRFDGF